MTIEIRRALPSSPEPCRCGIKPVVVEDTQSGQWSVGCRQAYMARPEDEPECKDRIVIVGQPSREVAVEAWNRFSMEKKGE